MVEWGDKRSQDIKQAATATILSGTLMRDATDSITDAMRIVNIGGSTASPRQEPWAATAQLHSVSDFESVLLAIAGHDLRQPLQIVQSAHELLGMGLRTSAELKHLRSGQNALERIKEQLAQLLTAVRIKEHTVALKLKPVRVQQVLKEACGENEEAAIRKGISLRMVSTDAMIESDGLLLGAALRNLVSNAVKYTEAGGRILVGCRHNGASIRIDVYDNGIGIPSEQMPKIFDAFTRVDTVRRDGLGIGLFIVRQALGLLGHRIDIASTPYRGSRFSILTPHLEGADQPYDNDDAKQWSAS
jgi:two-component system, OmpR family, phosphate regulon sensor histidine kinase PhoR